MVDEQATKGLADVVFLEGHPFGKITASRRRGIGATNAQIQRS